MPSKSLSKTAGKEVRSARENADLLLKALDEFKLEDTKLYALKKSPYADFVIVTTANSTAQARAVAGAMQKFCKAQGLTLMNKNNRDEVGGWNLIDCGDVIIHVFKEEARGFYKLEALLGDPVK